MYYEIIVSLKGLHVFATDKRSITNIHQLKWVYKLLKDRFDEKMGYEISVSK